MLDVTVVILTKNEEINLGDCLKSIKSFARRVVVIDSGSTDQTAEVYPHPFENYARQFNWALDNCKITTKWTLRLDADERLTPALCAELEKLAEEHAQDDVNGFTMEAWLYFMGRKIKHGCHNKRKVMLFKTCLLYTSDAADDLHRVDRRQRQMCIRDRYRRSKNGRAYGIERRAFSGLQGTFYSL